MCHPTELGKSMQFSQSYVLPVSLKWLLRRQKCMRLIYMLFRVKNVCTQFHLTLCNPMDCSPPGSSVHGNFQARILEWVAISFFRGSSQTRVIYTSCLGRQILYHCATRKPRYVKVSDQNRFFFREGKSAAVLSIQISIEYLSSTYPSLVKECPSQAHLF